jgi:hypothetical protein
LELYNYDNETTTTCLTEPIETESVHQFVGGKIIFVSDGQLLIVDPTAKKIGASLDFATRIKKVIWHADS